MNLSYQKTIAATVISVLYFAGLFGAMPVVAEYEDETVTGVNREDGRSTFWYYSNPENAVTEGGYYDCKDNISLNGKWKFHFCEKPADRIVDFYKTEFDVSKWTEIDVPGSWPLQGYDKPLYMNHPYEFNTQNPYPYKVPTEWNPVGAYRRVFTIPAEWKDKRIVLHFGAVKSSFYVYVNGKKVGYSQDSKMQAEFDITAYVNPDAENTLAVEVYRFSKGSYLEGQDMWRLAGIKRDVWLYATSKTYLQDFFVKAGLTSDYKNGTFDLTYTLRSKNNKTENVETTITLLDGSHNIIFEEKYEHCMKKGTSLIQSLSKRVENCQQWNAETPHLYTLLLSVKTPEETTWSSSKIGFRVVEMKNSQLHVNGQYIYIKGANRHEHHSKYGHFVPRETMEKDMELIKTFNLNAIRTSHYPADPYFYELCDKYGVYVVDEANIESHGLGAALQNAIDYSKHVSDDLGWEAMYLNRMERMFLRDKNHPSVIIWSMGNECGDGRNFVKGYEMLHRLDPTRFVQSEQAGARQHTDIYCPMYMKMENMKNYALSNSSTKPLILCEYMHGMGNSLGNFQDYWDLIETYPILQGGFVWDFVDQGIENTRAGQRFFEYGGGFGLEHIRNDGAFCNNGLFNPDRNPNPHAFEARKAYQSLRVKHSSLGGAYSDAPFAVLITNTYSFTNANNYAMQWSILRNGTVVESGNLQPDIKPMSSAVIDIPFKTVLSDDDEYFINFEFTTKQQEGLLPERWTVAYDQLPLNTLAKTVTGNRQPATDKLLSVTETADAIVIDGDGGLTASFDKSTGFLCKYAFGEMDFIKSPQTPDFYRVPNDNDQWDVENNIWFNTADKIVSSQVTIEKESVKGKKERYSKLIVSSKQKLTAGSEPQNTITFETVYTIYPTGQIDVLNRFTPEYYNGEGEMSIPRIGQVMQMNGSFSNAQWYGRGPWENYADRKTSALVGIYSMPVEKLGYDYPRPQENGYRTDVRWLELTNEQGSGLRITGSPLVCFNAQCNAQQDFFTADGKPVRYPIDMKKNKDYFLNIDYGQKGVGGDNSWGKPVHVEYRVLLRYYEYSYSMEIFKFREADVR